MIYVILILGLVIIYCSFKVEKIKTVSKSNNDFDSLIENSSDKFYEREILKSYVELETRVLELEDIVSSLEKKLDEKSNEIKLLYEKIENDIEDLEKNTECHENDIELITKSDDNLTEENKSFLNNNQEDLSLNIDNKDLKNKEILSLYKEGKSVDEIASELGMGKGEILLRIGLQKHLK